MARSAAWSWLHVAAFGDARGTDTRTDSITTWLRASNVGGVQLHEQITCLWSELDDDGYRWVIDLGYTPGSLIEVDDLEAAVFIIERFYREGRRS